MNQEIELESPDPWNDPEFTQRQRTKAGADPASSLSWSNIRALHQVRQFQERAWVLGLILAVVWLGLLLDPMVRPLVLGVLMALALTLGVLVGAMGLGLLGSGLFAVGDRVVAWFRQGSRWPDE
jgi:hypothetical protein